MKTEEKLSKAKAKAKEEVLKMMDNYFERYETAANNRKLTIDMVEDFMGEAMAEGERIIKETASAAINSIEADVIEKKKFVHTVTKN